MAIDNVKGFPGPQLQQRGDGAQIARTEPTKVQDETGRPSSVDTVSLTDAANRLKGLSESVTNLPVVDSARVEEIGREMEAGTFETDYQRVADKFLQLERDLNG